MSFKKDSFDAIGPTIVAFETLGNIPNSAQVFGVSVSGSQCGVYGESSLRPLGTRPSPTDVPNGTGVAGRGQRQGVKGDGDIGVSGVGRIGVFGEGVVGIEGHSFVGDGVSGQSDADNSSGVFGLNNGGGPGVMGSSPTGDGVVGLANADDKSGIFGLNNGGGPGVMGSSPTGDGVVGLANADDKSGVFGLNNGGGPGVMGRSPTGDGVVGLANANNKSGVFGFNRGAGPGVVGASDKGDGVVGLTDELEKSGVLGENTGKPNSKIAGLGVTTEIFGVTGRANAAVGIGVFGESANGVGLSGKGGLYGAMLQGERAPLRLVPAAATRGAPKNGFHQVGELFVDTRGSLFYCSGTGTPGKWNRVQLAPA